MFYFIIRTSFVHGRQTIAASQSSNLLIFEGSIGLRLFSNSSNGHSFTVSYLINKCGFSPELASRVSKSVHFETPEKPDSLIVFLENHGFSQTQIVNLIKRQPTLLLSHTEKTLLPKLEFLYSVGFSRLELAKLLSSYPHLLKYSLKKQIIPSFNLLRDLFQSDDKTIKAIKRFAGILAYDFESYLYPNMNVLRGIGVPESNILMLLNRHPRIFLYNPVLLKEIVEEVKGMGINSSRKKFLAAVHALTSMSKSTYLYPNMNVLRGIGVPESNILMLLNRHPRIFLYNPVLLKEIVEEVKGMGINSSRKKFLAAVHALTSMSKSTLEKKFDVYRRWGWSDQEIHEAFQRYPSCITASEDKIMAIMDFLVNKMGYNSTLIAKQSSVLSRSLRIIVPRALFAQELLSQGLVNDLKLSVLFDTSEKVFIRMFVDRFVNKAPDLLKLYKEKLKISEKKLEVS
ncbi:hypothetical protein GOBAR_DD00650 [Gossypium barbadense]|nr:hypothetical protein GOBAR_DD00650 [Gossypium barbadense]